MIERLLVGQNDISIPPSYTDVHATDWYYKAIAVLSERGILHGYSDGAFRPNETITRAEAVTLINRVLGKTYIDGMQNPFTDTQGHWVFEEITAAVN